MAITSHLTPFACAAPINARNCGVDIQRCRLQITGVVQGVGFRPHVYSLATRLGLSGFVGNDSNGVFLEIQGEPSQLQTFEADLASSPPPLAHIEIIQRFEVPSVQGDTGFLILHSENLATGHTSISPDIATCNACLAEMLNPADRRFRYPFINCTHCGPRFTIGRGTPYDRPLTTLASFQMCPACQAEYDAPRDRRFHAQPNACPDCGPQLTHLLGNETLRAEAALQATVKALANGKIVAIKGIGGFHLAVDATNEAAVKRLRERKHRWAKPLAVMVRDIDAAHEIASVSDAEADALQSNARPIVLLRRREDSTLATQIAPGNPEIGIMLPYSGLHTLLLQTSGPLVMTSGNLSNSPILWRNDDALAGLKDIADAFLLHDRDIHVPCDDSVLRISAGHESPIRRSRGYAPLPVRLAKSGPCVLTVGAELKSTFCLTQQNHAFLSQHIGDMESYETLAAFERSVDHFKSIFRAEPSVIACDLHPGYLSSQWARKYAAALRLPLVEVQHHHAHLAAAMAEHHLDGSSKILGLVFDGTGFGNDGAIWGGEVLFGDYRSFDRLLHLRYTSMPGGDSSIRHPYRMALAHLWAAEIPWHPDLPCVSAVPTSELDVLAQQLRKNFRCVPTSSMGRLFDAASALIGIRQTVQYEAQAAIEMEAISAPLPDATPYPFEICDNQIDPRPILRALVEDVRRQIPQLILAARFQLTIVELMLAAATHVRDITGCNILALTGGVMQNASVATLAATLLRSHGFQVLEHRTVPANDGGIALGQAAIALHQHSLFRPN